MEKQQQEVIRYQNHYDVNVAFRTSPRCFPVHWHKSAEFILALKDHCRYSVQGEEYDLQNGDVLLVWPTELHSVIDTPGEASVILQFPSTMVDSNLDLSTALSSMTSLHKISRAELPELCKTLREYILDCRYLGKSDDPFAETLSKMTIYKILLAIAQYGVDHMGSAAHRHIEAGSGYDKIREACAYITSNCDKDLSLPLVADNIGLSHYYFSRLFKEYSGTTFREYLSSQRVRRAKKLLSDECLSITDIAYQSGFQSISNFNRVFLEQTGSSPKDYRKMYQSARTTM